MDTFGLLIIITGIFVFGCAVILFFRRRRLPRHDDDDEPLVFKTYTALNFINKLKNERRNDVIILSVCLTILSLFIVSSLFFIYYFTENNVLIVNHYENYAPPDKIGEDFSAIKKIIEEDLPTPPKFLPIAPPFASNKKEEHFGLFLPKSSSCKEKRGEKSKCR